MMLLAQTVVIAGMMLLARTVVEVFLFVAAIRAAAQREQVTPLASIETLGGGRIV
jgi:hypothetical protein